MRSLTIPLLLAGCTLIASCARPPAPPAASPVPAGAAGGILQQCDAVDPAERPSCYESALLTVLRDDGVRPAMERLEAMGERHPGVRRDGHVYAHAIGLAAYTTAEEVGRTYAECTPAFQSGCYHGVIQSYFADQVERNGTESIDSEVVEALCRDYREDEDGRWQLFQCVHGMGHGLMMVHDYHLPRALEGCDLLASPWEREGCYGGAMMENIVQATVPHHEVGRPQMEHHGASAMESEHAHHGMATEAFEALDPEAPLYPCTVLEERYLTSCYQMQTSAILFFNGGDMAAAFQACDQAPERYRATCYQSLGRDISSYTVQDHAEALRLCSQGDPRYQPSCHAGYAKNLVDLTASADEAFAYCRSIPGSEDKRHCYLAVGEEIWALTAEPARREAMCQEAEPEFRGACRIGASLPGNEE